MAWKPNAGRYWGLENTFTKGWIDTKNIFIGAWRKQDLCYIVAESLAKLSPADRNGIDFSGSWLKKFLGRMLNVFTWPVNLPMLT